MQKNASFSALPFLRTMILKHVVSRIRGGRIGTVYGVIELHFRVRIRSLQILTVSYLKALVSV